MFLRKRGVLFVSMLLLLAFASAILIQEDFSQGTFYGTFHNSSGFVQLNISQGFLFGNFSSRVFDATFNSTWQNISWRTELCYGCELPSNGSLETGDFVSPVNMTGNVLLTHLNEQSGNITDYSGYDNTGIATLFEGPEYNAQGKFNTSLDFETGSGSSGEYISFGTPSQFNFTNQLTLEAWVNPESFSTASPSFNFPTIIDKDPAVFSLYFISASSRLTADLGASSITGSRIFSINNWYHVVLTYNGSQMRLYSNGILDGSPVSKTGNLARNNKILIVGSGWNGPTPNAFPFDGEIDEVAIYNRSLSAQEISEHYMRGALRLNLSVRSCDDGSCSGENYNQTGLASPQNLGLISNRYFQYKADFTTENLTYSPKLYNVSVGYLATNIAPLINITFPLNNSNYRAIQAAINYTVFDTDLDSCWYSLDSGLTNNSVTCGNNITGLTSSQGNNSWRVYANDTSGTERFGATSFFVDSLAPTINIISPVNNTLLTNNTVFVNYTVFDGGVGLSSCWWTNSSGAINTSVTCGTNFSFIGQEGVNLASVYANDSLGNINGAFVTININTQAPSVTILSPVEGSVFGNLTNIPLNFSALDPGLQACWYTLTEGFLNSSLLGCLNSTFNVSSNGLYEIKVYANDTNGNVGFDTNTFTVSVDAPSITPISPINGYFGSLASQNISFVYLPTDLDLQSCSLWTNSNGSFSLNQTNYTMASGQQHFFSLNLSNVSESSYLWAVGCNDTVGHNSITGNQTFYIDRTRPVVNLNEPTGTYSSLSNIPISLTYVDASPVQCIYNITFAATGNVVVSNSELLNCASTTFTLDTESSYFFNLAVNDSAGNINITRKSFTVSIPTGGGPGSSGGGSSGGGGGGSGIVTGVNSFSLSLGSLDTLKINRGESESIELPVTNKGLRFLNNCHFFAKGGVYNWISGEDIQSLSPGQTTKYIFNVNVPIDAEVGNYFVTLGANCVETNATFTYGIEVTGGEFEVTILNSERVGTKLRVSYVIENFGDKPKNITVNYKLLGKEDNLIIDGIIEPIEVLAGQRFEGTTEFELPKNSVGDYSLVIEATDGLDMAQKEQDVRLSRGGIAGFAISEGNLKTIGWFGLVTLLSFGVYFVLKTIRHQIALRKANEDLSRKFITIDLNH